MRKLELLADVLEYIEQHISEDIHTEDIAGACYCSRSTLEKLFRCVYRISVRDYLIRRRMTHAGKALVERPELSVLDIAVMYGYSSNEAFTRAFRQVWNQLPSDYRAKKRSLELFPRMEASLETGDDLMKTTKFDISNLYDIFQTRRECWFVCADIRSLIPINAISRKAGDMAIVESLQRMCDVADENDIVFRIGGDEFVLLTDSSDEAAAQAKMDRLLSRNGECIHFEGRDIPLNLYCCIIKLGAKAMRYSDLFPALGGALRDCKVEA